MKLIVGLVRALLALALVVGVACAADFVLRQVNPENTRHARFGEHCRTIHDDYMREDGKAPPAHCITVHFGTPRKPIGVAGDVDFGFGREMDDTLHLGVADVTLPLLASEEKDGQKGVRKRGEVDLKEDGAPETKDDTIKYAAITLIEEEGEESFIASLDDALDDADTNALLVFVHGYNQSFDTALIRAAQIAIDLTFDPEDPANIADDKPYYGEPSYAFGSPVLFSWPNGSFLCAYCSDQKKAELSAPYLTQFLSLLMREADDLEEINIVVHSMGNRVLVRAIEDIAREHVRLKRIKKFRIVNAAADVARDEYAERMAQAEAEGGAEFAPQVTIYASQNDIAMAVSWLVNGFKTRLGQIIPTQRPFESADDRYVTVDTNVVSADLFGHGYYSENGNVIADMSCFFADRPIGAERAIAPAPSLSDGRRHYRFVQSGESGLSVCAPGAPPLVLADADQYFSSIGLTYDEYGRKRREALEGPPVLEPQAPPSPAQPIFAVAYFDFEASALNETTLRFIDELILDIQRQSSPVPVARIVIVGHADAAEAAISQQDAQDLSLRRAEVVRDYLISNGFEPDVFELFARGASEPAVPTAAGVREPLNRRTEIMVFFE